MQTNGANSHQHEVSEKRPTPDIFTTRLDIELCACGARRCVDQDGAPATPWRSINLGTKPGGNEGAGAAPRTSPKSALDELITCGNCGQPMVLATPGRSKRPTTRARVGVPRRGCTPAGRRCCWFARRCGQS